MAIGYRQFAISIAIRNQHRVTIAEKPVTGLYGMLIGT
jgi:hypothetical protein